MEISEKYLCKQFLKIALGFLCFNSALCFGQTDPDAKTEKIGPPSQEKFIEVDAVAAPWRSSGCLVVVPKSREPDCYLVTEPLFKQANIVNIYNEDGSLWYSLDLEIDYSLPMIKAKNKDFIPLATSWPRALLRMVAESDHWYKVEVNDKTQAIKYAMKDAQEWSKTPWRRWIYESGPLFLREQKILDKPDGSPIETNETMQIDKVNILQVEGDWVQVREFAKNDGFTGWVRWRNGRKILVGCKLSGSSSYQDVKYVDEDR